MHENIRDWLKWDIKLWASNIKSSIRAALMAWFIGKIYELKPDMHYVLSLKKPMRKEMRALSEALPLLNKGSKGWFMWGPGLEVQQLREFLREYEFFAREDEFHWANIMLFYAAERQEYDAVDEILHKYTPEALQELASMCTTVKDKATALL